MKNERNGSNVEIKNTILVHFIICLGQTGTKINTHFYVSNSMEGIYVPNHEAGTKVSAFKMYD